MLVFNLKVTTCVNTPLLRHQVGWLNRSILSYTPYGLYVPTLIDGKSVGLQYSSTLDEWESTAIRLAQNNTRGYVKIVDWGIEPESIEKITNSSYNFAKATETYGIKSQNDSYNNAYGGYGSVSQLGNYTNLSNSQEAQGVSQQIKNREDILNTLMEGSYMPNMVKKCSELITSDKKKAIKTKSEN